MVFFVEDSPSALSKRRKFAPCPSPATAPSRSPELDLGRDFRVYATSSSSPPSSSLFRSGSAYGKYDDDDDDDDEEEFYEFTVEDYCRIMDTRRGDELLKMPSMVPEAVIRVRFPENHTLEVVFRSSEKVQCLIDFLMRLVARPDLPFYLYTTPPKNCVKDLSQDFYSAGFVPGAVLYFAYDLPQGHEASAPSSSAFLQAEILPLKNSCGDSATLKPFIIAPQLIPASLRSCSTFQTG